MARKGVVTITENTTATLPDAGALHAEVELYLAFYSILRSGNTRVDTPLDVEWTDAQLDALAWS